MTTRSPGWTSPRISIWSPEATPVFTGTGDDPAIPYQVDGDYLGETSRLEFRHVPDAVRLVFPAPPLPSG